jgi:methylmalonyl-CoA/ethylmalonyl-CoA epimerase
MTSAAGRSFRILGINHLGLAPKDAAKARSFFTNALGLGFLGEELVKDQMTNTVMIDSAHAPTSGSDLTSTLTSTADNSGAGVPTGRPMLEILENETGPDGPKPGPIAAFLAKKGSGIHHVALQVDHVENAIAWLKQNGVRLIDETPRKGSHNTKIAFIHPESTGGLLVELVQQL